MPRPKRHLLAIAEETSSPPASLPKGHVVAKVQKAEGKNLYTVLPPKADQSLLVELPSRFRSQIWIKRGGYVIVNTSVFDGRDNKLDGEIVNIVREERQWRKQAYWPSEFVESTAYSDDSGQDQSTVGKMPPTDDSDVSE